MPDIDVDFCIDGREEVYKYVVDRYGGGDYVAQIITFGKLKTRGCDPRRRTRPEPPVAGSGCDRQVGSRRPQHFAGGCPEAGAAGYGSSSKQKAEYGDLIQICRVLEGLRGTPRPTPPEWSSPIALWSSTCRCFGGKKGEVVTQYDMKIVGKDRAG